MNSDYYTVNERSCDTWSWSDDSLCSRLQPKCHCVLVSFYLREEVVFPLVSACLSLSTMWSANTSVCLSRTHPNTRGSNTFKWKWITGQTATLWHLWVLLVFTFLTVLHNKSRKMRECESDFSFKEMKKESTQNIASANNAGKAYVPWPVWKT